MRHQRPALLLILALAAACGPGGDGGPTQPLPVESVSVAPGAVALIVGQLEQLNATLRDASGNPLAGRAISWTSSNAGVATVSTSGVITALAPGTSTILATSEGKSGSATVTVSPVPVATVAVTLGASGLVVGQTTQASAMLHATSGALLTDRSVTWMTSNATVASVSLGGLVTALAPGTAMIIATSEGKTAAAPISVDRVSAITLLFRRETPGDPSMMIANGVSTVPLEIEVRGASGALLSVTGGLQRLANGTEFTGSDFRTSQPGTVTLSVNGYGIQSNALVVTARPEESYPVIRLPLVFHVYNNSARQWTAAWANQMVQLLNGFFRHAATNGLPEDPNAVDTYIEFYLAERDPAGNLLAVPGVHPLNEAADVLNAAGDAVGSQYLFQCLGHTWNPSRYINVFIADKGGVAVRQSRFAAGTVPAWGMHGSLSTNAQWASFLHFAIAHDALLYQPRELANVLAHELGHLLSLDHPFSQLADRSCPAADPDGVVDTPRYDIASWQDLATLVVNNRQVRLYNGCGGRPFTEVNLMGYTTFHSKSFTYSQRQRMQYQLAWAYLYPTLINQTR